MHAGAASFSFLDLEAASFSPTVQRWVFLAFYVVCAAVTWTVFLRRPRLTSDSAVVVEAESLVLEAETNASSANSSAR